MNKIEELGEVSSRHRPRSSGDAPGPRQNAVRTPVSKEALFDLPVSLPPAVAKQLPGPTAVHGAGEVVDVRASSLRTGSLYALFRAGAPAVRVMAEPAVSRLWSELMPSSPDATHSALGEQFPWSSGLRSLALNSNASSCVGTRMGDVVYASPRLLTYVARKMVLHRPEAEGAVRVEPPSFQQPGGPFQLPNTLAESVWSLSTRLLEALTPAGFLFPRRAVTIERLMYDGTLEDLERRVQLLRGSGGRFSQLGHRIDDAWFDASGPFRRPLARYAYAFGSLVPRFARWLKELNVAARSRAPEELEPAGAAVLGEAHTDGRLFSCLVSQRDVVRTEFWTGDRWGELPVTDDSLVIFPGRMAQTLFGLRPTRHRILHLGGRPGGPVNGTLMFGLQQVPQPR